MGAGPTAAAGDGGAGRSDTGPLASDAGRSTVDLSGSAPAVRIGGGSGEDAAEGAGAAAPVGSAAGADAWSADRTDAVAAAAAGSGASDWSAPVGTRRPVTGLTGCEPDAAARDGPGGEAILSAASPAWADSAAVGPARSRRNGTCGAAAVDSAGNRSGGRGGAASAASGRAGGADTLSKRSPADPSTVARIGSRRGGDACGGGVSGGGAPCSRFCNGGLDTGGVGGVPSGPATTAAPGAAGGTDPAGARVSEVSAAAIGSA